MRHDCYAVGTMGQYLYICSRCAECYICRHKAVFFTDADMWMWRNRKGQFEDVILDGRIKHELR